MRRCVILHLKNSLNHTPLLSLTFRFSDFLALRLGRCHSAIAELELRLSGYIHNRIHAFSLIRIIAYPHTK